MNTPTAATWVADGTICEGCTREFIAGDLMCFAVDPPNTIATCSNPPVCAECVTGWTDSYGTWIKNLTATDEGASWEWVRVI